MASLPEYVQILLSADCESAEFKNAVKELEKHPGHEVMLEKYALGETDWWEETREILREDGLPTESSGASSILIEFDPECSGLGGELGDEVDDAPGIDVERVSLDFLEPSHPELLGRFGRYEIEGVLGTGGMGVVLRAFDSDLHRVVAIKVLAPHLAHHSSARLRFAREAQAAAAVVHPNVIQIHTVDSEAKVPHLVMQYVPGESLQRRVDMSGPVSVTDALRIAIQTASGLEAAHAQGLVHRDVKPANILLEENVDRVLLSDFGLARAVDDASLTKTGIVAGTPFYMSPEQALGESIDHRSDLFSLGSVLYFMLAGRPPFRASGAMAVLHKICQSSHQSLRELNVEVPVELSEVVDRCLEKRSGHRFQSASELRESLSELLSLLQTGQLRLQSKGACSERELARKRSARFGIAIGCGLLLSTVVALIASVLNNRGEAPEKSGSLAFAVPPEEARDAGIVDLAPDVELVLSAPGSAELFSNSHLELEIVNRSGRELGELRLTGLFRNVSPLTSRTNGVRRMRKSTVAATFCEWELDPLGATDSIKIPFLAKPIAMPASFRLELTGPTGVLHSLEHALESQSPAGEEEHVLGEILDEDQFWGSVQGVQFMLDAVNTAAPWQTWTPTSQQDGFDTEVRSIQSQIDAMSSDLR